MAVCGRLLHTIAQSTLPRRDELPRVDTRTFDRMRATPLPPRSLFSRAQWRERGVSTRRLKGPELTTLFRGYSTPTAAPASVNTMCKVLQQQVAPEAVVSHSTAAALLGIALPWWVDNGIGALASAAYGDGPGFTVPSTLPQPPRAPDVPSDDDELPLFWTKRLESGLPLSRSGAGTGPPPAVRPLTNPPDLHVSVPRGVKLSLGPHVVVHQMSPSTTYRSLGLVMSHPCTALLEIASVLDHDDLVIAIDSLLTRDSPRRAKRLAQIHDSLDTHRGRWGAARLRRALQDARPLTDSPGETRSRLLLLRAGFPEPVINFAVQDTDTDTTRYLDLAYPELGIAVEYDGDYHRRDQAQWRADQGRKDSLESLGWKLVTWTAADIKSPQRALTALRRRFQAAGSSAPPASNWSGRNGRRLARSMRPPTRR